MTRGEWNRWAARVGALVLGCNVVGLVGCVQPSLQRQPDALAAARGASQPPGKEEGGESLILRPEGLAQEKAAPVANYPDEVASQLTKAREAFRKQEYVTAEDLFGAVADKERNPPQAIQEGMFYKAECLRLQGHFPKAADNYVGLMNKFPSTSYREQCCQHVFDIANQWLDVVRAEMKERKESKSWFVMPNVINFDRDKPLLDLEGRAIEKLEQVRMHDVSGPLADRALFLCGVVKMYRENYREADHYFSQIYLRHPDSKLTPKALELGIQCKHLSTGGSDYDGRKSAEARKMVSAALVSYPELANDKEMRHYLEGQMASINVQQAEKEYKMAEFYRTTGHPASAYFYYELVRRRYPGTKYAQMAEQRWAELRAKVEQEQGPPPTPPGAAAPQPSPNRLPASLQKQ